MAAGTGLTSTPGTVVYTDDQRAGRSENYFLDAGAANALTGNLTNIDGSAVTLVAGFRVLVKTANTLQAGTNTLALNGGAAKSIFNYRGVNINTTVASGVIIDLAYDGTNWIMLSSLAPTKWAI